jgi:hypothetical protein
LTLRIPVLIQQFNSTLTHLNMHYSPQVDDYVRWKDLEGWIYFKCDDYITIEISVKDKIDDLVPMHKKTHCCVLCFTHDFAELEYIKNRRDSGVDQYKSQQNRYSDPQ